jgi:hypothetical protein
MNTSHVVTSAFPIDPSDVGGLATALGVSRELGSANQTDVTLLAPDTAAGTFGPFKVQGADPLATAAQDRWVSWFGVGYCPSFFPAAFTAPVLPPEMLALVYPKDPAVGSGDTVESVFRHVEKHCDHGALDAFANRFVRPLSDLVAGSVVNFQSFFFDRVIEKVSDALRSRGVLTSLHIHEAIPENLIDHRFGQEFLRRVCNTDAIFFHNDTFLKRFSDQAARMGLKIPILKRYDLGIEQEFIANSVGTVDATNYEATIPGYLQLNPDQKELIKEVFAIRARPNIHPFFCIDRIDIVKGSHVVYAAVDQFLAARMATGLSLNDLKRDYRFFFLQRPSLWGDELPIHLTRNYVNHCSKALLALVEKYPGIVVNAEPLSGIQRVALPAMLAGATCLSGSISEGLNLAVMEASAASHMTKVPGAIICGDGAGFAMRLRELRQDHLAHFPTSGSIEEFRECILSADSARRANPVGVRDLNSELATKMIFPRRDSLIVDPGNI